MNAPHKKFPETKNLGQQLKPQAVPAHQFKPFVAQSKTASATPNAARPAAPPAYRPQPKPIAAQVKTPNPIQAKARPVAPPVYHPQPVPKVLQLKTAHTQPHAAQAKTAVKPPAAPPAYRPQSVPKVCQAKMAQTPNSASSPFGGNAVAGGLGKGLLPKPKINLPPSRAIIQRSASSSAAAAASSSDEEDFDWSSYPTQDNYLAPKKTGISLVGLDFDEDDTKDYTYKSKQVRAAFKKGLREELMKAQSKGGKLYCALAGACYKVTGGHQADHEIALTAGKEVWTSGSGNVHTTAPPIDHYSPTWAARLEKLNKSAAAGNWDVAKYQQEVTAAYNAPPLRVVHMYCNSKLPK